MTTEQIDHMRAFYDGVQARRVQELKDSLAFHKWLHEEATKDTERCRARLQAATGIARN